MDSMVRWCQSYSAELAIDIPPRDAGTDKMLAKTSSPSPTWTHSDGQLEVYEAQALAVPQKPNLHWTRPVRSQELDSELRVLTVEFASASKRLRLATCC